MKRLSQGKLACLVVLCCQSVMSPSWADPVAAVQLMRTSGCGGILPAASALRHSRQLDRAAALWAAGASPQAAAERSGYPARATVGLRVSGPDDAISQELRRMQCRRVVDRELNDLGAYRSGTQTWVLMAKSDAALGPSAAASSQAEISAARVLNLVNAVRASGTHCGGQSFGAAPALRLSDGLSRVAAEHALDMAHHDYFEHVDLIGHTPADRVRAAGYREKLIGENIAYGPTSADEVVAGWLHSPGHCQNIMDPRFVEMGLALAPGRGPRRGLYWDQVLTQPAQ